MDIVHNIGASFVSLTLDLVSIYPDHYRIPKIIFELNILPWEIKRHFWMRFNKPRLMRYFWEDHPRGVTRGLLSNLSQILSAQLNVISCSQWFIREVIYEFPKRISDLEKLIDLEEIKTSFDLSEIEALKRMLKLFLEIACQDHRK